MTAIPLKNIEGCLVAKTIEEHIECHLKNGTHIPIEDIEPATRLIMISINQEIGQKKITLNREKLIDVLSKTISPHSDDNADAILNALPELVEVQK